MTGTALDRRGIAALIPHQGTMCLLERVTHWNHAGIACEAEGHRDPAHPMRSASGLLAACAIEYAAQAMAVHGALVGQDEGRAPSPGYLASARAVTLHRWRLDDLPGRLEIEATREAGDDRQVLYRFEVRHAGTSVANGRASVVLNTPLESA